MFDDRRVSRPFLFFSPPIKTTRGLFFIFSFSILFFFLMLADQRFSKNRIFRKIINLEQSNPFIYKNR